MIRSGSCELKKNEQVLLRVLQDTGSASKAALERATGMRPGTVIDCVASLKRKGLIRDVGLADIPRGRKPTLFKIVPESRTVMTLCVRKGQINAGVVDLAGNVTARVDMADENLGQKETLMQVTVRCLQKLLRKVGTSRDKILGIGVALPGVVDRDRSELLYSAHHPTWQHVPFRDLIQRELRWETIVENDTRCATLAEKWFGLGKGLKNFLLVDAGEGIGVGMVFGGEIYGGTSWGSGEFGHMTIDMNGPLCACGNRGCLEAMASTGVLADRVRKLVKNGVRTSVMDSVRRPEGITPQTVLEAAAKHDKVAYEAIQDIATLIGIGVANLINLLNPRMVILGGELAQAGDAFLEPVKRAVRARVLPSGQQELRIELSRFGSTGELIGATAPFVERIFGHS